MAVVGVSHLVAEKVVAPVEVGEAKEMAVDGQVEQAIHPAVDVAMQSRAVVKNK